MRFLMLNWRDPENPKTGGAERVTQGYLADLVRRGHEVYWYSEYFEGGTSTSEIDGIHIVRGGTNVLSRLFHVKNWYRQQPRFDLVIDQHHGVPWYSPWWCGTHCISYIHEVLGSIWRSFYHGWRLPVGIVGPWQERKTLWMYRKVPFWTSCEATAKALRQIGVESVTRIPYGVDIVPLAFLEPKPLRQPLKLVFVSRLAPNKRVDHAIRMTEILLNCGIDVSLQIAGGGDSLNDLKNFTAEKGLDKKVTFTGYLPEREKDLLLQQAHFLVHTSVREGWGLNVIEANAMGTPTLVYPAEGLTESTLKNETGLISEEETPESLAKCLLAKLDDQVFYDKIREAAWKRACGFHWSKILPLASDWLEATARGERNVPYGASWR